ncbi:MAG: DUF2497 domain-containing protein, partial [Magnetococcales bacterium]|nr:DUF2497 domain-containing protein [Magnetococcales bacterium]
DDDLESEASVDAELEAAFSEEAEPEDLEIADLEENLDDDLESEASVDAELEAAFSEEAEPEEETTKTTAAVGAITPEFLLENYGGQVESIVREMTRTLLQERLPQLLEQVVREELERIKNGL